MVVPQAKILTHSHELRARKQIDLMPDCANQDHNEISAIGNGIKIYSPPMHIN